MDTYALLRTLGALATVLGLLAGALWAVRRFGIRLPNRIGGGDGTRRLEVIERTMIDGRRSVALLRRDGREHLILLSPEGNVLLEAGIVRDEIDHAAEAARLEAQREAMEASRAQSEAMRDSFFAMVDKARSGVKDRVEAAQPVVQQVKKRVQPEGNRAKPRGRGGSRRA
ncbi:FliO/MopB family protein [Novosphingobium sp. M1R2S20]|uniref:FliO/MopB family protein n=1 Tax=Novosphingobium rhizovicinum TaxID=3228928 RepID=A0ABV3R8V8_9SPHN